jgi:predicted aspartyl protease
MMSTMRRSILLLALAAAIGLAPQPLDAQIYRWVDEAGVPHYGEGIDTVPERYRANATPLRLRNKPAASDTAPSQRTPAGGTVIRHSPGQPIIADVRINGAASARLILDTGADRTLISPRALAAAGVSLSRIVATGRVVGVTGSDRLPYVVIDSLEIGGVRVGRMAVGAYEVAEAEGDGLLGRDVLDRFNVAIDAARGLITLSPK